MNYIKKAKLFLITILLLLVSSPIFSQNRDSSNKSNVTLSSESEGDKSKNIRKAYNNFSSKIDSISFKNKSELIDQLKNLEHISGTVYFSGTGFPNVIAKSLFNGSGAALSDCLDKCVPGSRISFYKCIIRSSDGKDSKTLNKTILFQ